MQIIYYSRHQTFSILRPKQGFTYIGAKLFNRLKPKAIIELYDNSLYANNILTRHQTSCILRPKKELRNGDLMYDIIDNWNRIGRNLREEKYCKELKNKIKSLQNKYLKCDIKELLHLPPKSK